MLYKFIKGLKVNLPTSNFIEGAYYQCTDTGELFFAASSDTLINTADYLKEPIEDLTTVVESLENNKQDKLEDGVNIKTINNKTLLGEGNLNFKGDYTFSSGTQTSSDITLVEGELTYLINTLGTVFNTLTIKPSSNPKKGYLNKMLFLNTTDTDCKLVFSDDLGTVYYNEEITLDANADTEITWMLLEDDSYVFYKKVLFIKPVETRKLVFKNTDTEDYTLYVDAGNDTADASRDIQYSLDGTTWNKILPSSGTKSIVIPANGEIYIRGNNPTGLHTTEDNFVHIWGDPYGSIEVEGSVMSLLTYEGDELIAIPEDLCFMYLFSGFESMVKAPELPATILKDNCYTAMFYGCSALKEAPELPATELCNNCYLSMFEDCYELITAPELSATVLAKSCYESMFNNCGSLETPPDLPATTLAETCYWRMFNNCSSLKTAPALSSVNLKEECCGYMFSGCSMLEEAPELPATELANACYIGMFKGCSSLVKAPKLSATILKEACYQEMFKSCFNLNYIDCQATDITANYCTKDWVMEVASSGDFYSSKEAYNSWETGISGVPNGWTKHGLKITDGPLIFTAIENGETILKYNIQGSITPSIQYSLDDGETWENIGESTTLNKGEKVYIKGNNKTGLSKSASRYFYFSTEDNKKISVEGSVMSLIDDGADEVKTMPSNYCFYRLFADSSITTMPSLKATVLKPYCYKEMFSNCSYLDDSVELPATELPNYCYDSMFKNSGITVLPVLPIIDSISTRSFQYTFQNTKIKVASISVKQYNSSGNHGFFGTFRDCELLENAYIRIGGTYRHDGGEDEMFMNCTSLTNVKLLKEADVWCWNILTNVNPVGTLTLSTGFDIETGPGGIPETWILLHEDFPPFE